MAVHVLPIWARNTYGCPEVNTVPKSGIYRELSPFILGPVNTFIPAVFAQNLENLWQFSKVYKEHVASDGYPSMNWFIWRAKGWADKQAHRYPMGKGKKPEYSWWDSEKLKYIDARKRIYVRVYAEHVVRTRSYELLHKLYTIKGEVTLRDYDAYDHIRMGMNLSDVINNPDRIMGHAFVLAMLLEGCLEECLE